MWVAAVRALHGMALHCMALSEAESVAVPGRRYKHWRASGRMRRELQVHLAMHRTDWQPCCAGTTGQGCGCLFEVDVVDS